jgi:formylglycine-generating enzyme required for sulfatase activity
MADIFLSYSSRDKDRVKPLVRALEREGWKVWWDRKTRAGDIFDQLIEQELESSRGVVVVWSTHSVQSRWVRVEAEEGLGKGALFPVKIDPVRIPIAFRLNQAVDLVGWEGNAEHPEFQHLVQSIKEKIGQGENSSEAVQPEPSPWPINKILPIAGVVVLVVGIIYGLIRGSDDSAMDPGQTPSSSEQVRPTPESGVKENTRTLTLPNGKTLKLQMVDLPGGEFQMGGTGSDYEKPVHRVRVAPFSIGKFEVTQAQWKAVMGSNPSHFKGETRPVENVSWNDAQEFLREIGNGYRLPTEAEWEYAARGGTTTEYSFGDDESKLGEYAWFRGNSNGQTQPVATRLPNPFELFDMHGNVWEWVEDHWHDNYEGAPTDGSAWLIDDDNARRVLRGGSWHYISLLRSAYRSNFNPAYHDYSLGFRVVVGAQTQPGR